MFSPSYFQMETIDQMKGLIANFPLAALSSNGESSPVVAHVPFILEMSKNENLELIGHVNRINPIVSALETTSKALAIFRGADAYISPDYYPSKANDPRVVPTWNYEVVEVTGDAEILTGTDDIIHAISILTERMETQRENPWKVQDAPEDYIAKMCRGIVGIRLSNLTIEGVSKLSQNKNSVDFEGVISGLKNEPSFRLKEVADRMRKQGDAK